MKQVLRAITLVAALFTAFSAHSQLPDGSICPDFTGTDITGTTWNLYDILAEGKAVIIQVSATWSLPCYNYHSSNELIEFYNTYGPDGTDEAMVLFIEGYAASGLNDLLGITENSQGDFVTGTPFPIIDDASIGIALEIGYFPTVYTVCPNWVITETGQISMEDHYSFIQETACQPASYSNDPSLISYNGEPLVCSEAVVPVTLMNYGLDPLTSATIEVTSGGTVLASFDWTGNLSTYEVEEVIVGTIPVDGLFDIDVSIADNDDYAANNVLSSIVEQGDAETSSTHILVVLLTDDWGAETGWDITNNATGEVVSSVEAGQLDNNISYQWDVFLPSAGCYAFRITDTYGDGMHGEQWNGSNGSCSVYSLYNDNYFSTIYQYDGSYDFEVEKALAEVIPGCNDPAACNYDEEDVDDSACVYPGCIDPEACNFDASAGCEDDTCIYPPAITVSGSVITDAFSAEIYSVEGIVNATYNWEVSGGSIPVDNGNTIEVFWGGEGVGEVCVTVIAGNCPAVMECETVVVTPNNDMPGCTTVQACNYDPNATVDNGSCLFTGDSCDDGDPETFNDVIQVDCSCSGEVIVDVPGCTAVQACNYDPNATVDNGSCLFTGDSCDDGDPETVNDVIQPDCSCAGEVVEENEGCTDPEACNYDPEAVEDDGSCEYVELFSPTGNLAPELFSSEVYSYPETMGSSYQWSTSLGAITSGQGTPQVTITWGTQGTGQLCIIETREDGCAGQQVCENVVVLPTDVQELENDAVVVYPNPASTHVNVILPEAWLGGHYTLLDLQGRVLLQDVIDQTPLVIPTIMLAGGRYELNIQVNGATMSKSLLIVK